MTGPQILAVPQKAPAAKTVRLDAVLKTSWGRLLVPSLTDLFFIAVMSWLFLAGEFGWKGLLNDADAGWHIRTGEHILDTGVVPRTDLFSFSKPGEKWFAWEWGSDVLMALLHRAGGLKALVLAAATLITLFAALLLRRIAGQGVSLWVMVPVAMLGVGASSLHFLARPHLFTMLFLVITAWLVEVDRRRRTPWIWVLAPLTAVWVNLHGGFPAGIAVLGIAVVGSAAEAALAGKPWREWDLALRYTLVAIACAVASLLNPFGIGVHLHIYEYLRSDWIQSVVQEFQAPNFRGENAAQFEALLFAGLLAAAGLLKRREITPALWILGFGHLALTSARHIPVFVAVAAPWIAYEAAHWWAHWTSGASRKSIAGILDGIGRDLGPSFRRTSLWGVALVVVLAFLDKPLKWPKDFPEELFPAKIVAEHRELLRSSRVLTQDQWADYLIYHHYPRQKVFVDGRSDFYGQELGGEYLRMMNAQHDWARLVDKHGFEVALVPVEWPLAELLKRDGRWRLLADDGKALLFSRSRR